MSRLGAAALVTLAVALVLQIGTSGARDTSLLAHCGSVAVGDVVGQVTTLVHTSVWKNETAIASAPSALRAKHFLCTGSSGQALFTLTRSKTSNCNVLPLARMQLYPDASRVIQFLPTSTKTGRTWCSTSKGKQAWFGGTTGRTRLYTVDPVFSVTVTSRSTTVRMTYGFFAVWTLRTRTTPVILGPLQQVVVTPTGAINGPTAFAPTAGDRTAIAALRTAVPTPNYTRPAAGTSQVLARMYARGSIRVGLEPEAASPELAAFTKRWFTALARRWKLRLEVVSDASPDALAAGRIDVAVTPTRAESGVDVTPLPFAEDDGENWDLELLPEAPLVGGFRRYLQNSLDAGDYAGHYRAAFAAEPDYDRFRTFLFPTLPPPPS